MALLGTHSYLEAGTSREFSDAVQQPQHNGTTQASLAVQSDNSLFLDLLPLLAVNLVAVSYQLGLGPIGWAYIGELYPVDMRTVLGGFSSMNINIFISLVIKTYPSLKASGLRPWGTYWLYASVAVCAALFGATLLPETKGKSLAEVSEYFDVCCAFKKKPIDETEYVVIGEDKHEDITLSKSFIYQETGKASELLSGAKEEKLLRRSVEPGEEEVALKRRTLELSMLEEVIRQKVEEAEPIVRPEELDQLLSED
jgi:hypothetical protein